LSVWVYNPKPLTTWPNKAVALVEAELLLGDRVRVLTQESQICKPAVGLAEAKPNLMLNEDWLDGLIRTAAQRDGK
jgi:hypothetical protein